MWNPLQIFEREIAEFENCTFRNVEGPVQRTQHTPRQREINIRQDKTKSTYANLAQENGFSPVYLLSSKSLHLLEKSVINMIWLLLPIFDWSIVNDWSKWFAISSSHLFVVPISVLWVGLQKNI
jgi:hypothetical protein